MVTVIHLRHSKQQGLGVSVAAVTKAAQALSSFLNTPNQIVRRREIYVRAPVP